jgi:Cyclic nucleotide-binding domain
VTSRHAYEAAATIAKQGAVMQSLVIVSWGVVVVWERRGNGVALDSTRLTSGFYIGETGLLTGEALGETLRHSRRPLLTK